ncbi:MAG: SMP-30/gluconolactonase/LRE family protein [Planctomycetota bacterium]|nr:SMP-30/gluconolactonase/LRE family protein [Planctomycetota bacterium]
MARQAELLLKIGTQLGEGVVWDHVNEELAWVDILDNKVFVYDPETKENRACDVGHHVGTVAPRNGGGLIAALRPGIAALDTVTGKVEILKAVAFDDPNSRFNDGKCDPQGRLWVGTLEYDFKPGHASLFRVDADLTVTKMVDKVTISNGLCWSLDRKTFYYIDTPTRRIDAFDYDERSGNIAERRTAVAIPEEKGWPDGMNIDSEGRLWVAHYGGGRVCCWDPKTGACVEEIFVPGAKNVTNCAFGGKDLKDLYISTARQHLSAEDPAPAAERGGPLRLPLGCRGRAGVRVRGLTSPRPLFSCAPFLSLWGSDCCSILLTCFGVTSKY